MKTAIWAAVSTPEQAEEDKESIKVQLQNGRELIKSRNWKLTQEYVVPGQSRTNYISLSHAEEAIPQLHQLLEDASKGRYELLYVYDLNRFRNLMLQIFEVLCDYNIQIYNYDDPIQPVLPQLYTPERKNAVRLNIKLHDILSAQEINTLQKHYREKMPARITAKKLHPGLGLPPYAYRKPIHLIADPNAVLEVIPEEARVLHMIKGWFLSEGLSLTEIASRLNQMKIPPPRRGQWWYSVVRYLLANPFYAGIVSFGHTQRVRDKRKRTVLRVKGQHPVHAQGLHKPIWSKETHQLILAELQRRTNAQPGIAIRPLSRLLRCGVCGAVMWAQSTPAGQYWRCSSSLKAHTYINDKVALPLIIDEIIKAVKDRNNIPIPPPEDKRPAYQAEIRELKLKQNKWMDLYEDSPLDKDTLNRRLRDIQTRLTRTEDLLSQAEAETTRSHSLRAEFNEFAKSIETLPKYIRTAPARRVNTTLHRYIESVTIAKDHTITLHWR